MTTPVSSAERKRRLDAVADCKARGLSLSAAARALGIKPHTLHVWLWNDTGEKVAVKAPEVPPPEPREVRDAAFYRRQNADLARKLSDAEHLAEELGGLRRVGISVPEWLGGAKSGGSSRSILIAHTSDVHMGEVVAAGEIEGMNRYSPDVARARMQRYFEAVCDIGPRWLHDSTCDGVLLTMGGDLVSGDIHEELLRTNALTSQEQVRAVVETYEAGLGMLLAQFGQVHVAAVPGNHGRTTMKTPAKLAARLSYDILAADMLRDRFRGDGRVTWSISEGADVRVPVYGRTILLTHGDKMGTGGGQGFAGPVLPIIRGGNKVRLQSASAGLGCDLVLSGHYHTSAAPPGILANGSVVGYSEFGNSIRAAVEPPKQWLARFSLQWGLCETLAVQLETAPRRMRLK